MMFDIASTALPQVKAGKLKALAVTSAKRSPLRPNMPTMIEAGFRTSRSVAWYMLLAPANLPKDVLASLNAEADKALQTIRRAQDARRRSASSSPAARRSRRDAFLRSRDDEVGRGRQGHRHQGAVIALMKIFDVHSHWGTQRGYPLRTEAELAQQKTSWNSEPRYHTEDEMADYFRAQGVQDDPRLRLHQEPAARRGARVATTTRSRRSAASRRRSSASGCRSIRARRRRRRRIRALHRSRARASSATASSGAGHGLPCDDPIYAPFYDVARRPDVPVLVLVGYTGAGAGHPGRRRHDARSLPSALRRRAGGAAARTSRSSPAVPRGRGRTR